MMTELESEKVSSDNKKDKYSVVSYCRSDLVRKTFVHICNLDEFWTIYKTTNILTLNKANERVPFDIVMNINKIDDKVHFCIKNRSLELEKALCNVSLQSSVSKNKFKVLPMLSDGKTFEVQKSFLLTTGQEYVFFGILKVIFKFYCAECILYNTIHTTISHYDDKKYMDFATDNTSTIILKTNKNEYLINNDLLCAKSKKFESLFEDKDQKHTIISLPSMSEDVILMFINFLQCNSTFISENVELKKLFALFTLADRFEVTDLKTICEQYIKEYILLRADTLGEYNALDILRFAYDNSLQDLIKLATDFIALNINHYLHCKHFLDLTKEHPELYTHLKEVELNVRKAYFEI
ncbi:uncharacterized protein LOC116846864 [Odontomachus brunneus]|uniref:uncharacterized protein LOC116846864 n=1 Tax=Odontomachus brunneus TaxID=486640 RepID=UPI0013F1B365|nr:uncharacterized protein LOC116846864 [Odontomachus brunneus]